MKNQKSKLETLFKTQNRSKKHGFIVINQSRFKNIT